MDKNCYKFLRYLVTKTEITFDEYYASCELNKMSKFFAIKMFIFLTKENYVVKSNNGTILPTYKAVSYVNSRKYENKIKCYSFIFSPIFGYVISYLLGFVSKDFITTLIKELLKILNL